MRPVLLGLLGAALLESCGGDSPRGGDRTWDGAASTGRVRGVVRLVGDPPRRRRIDLGTDEFCRRANPGPVYSEEVLVGPRGGLKNVFVWVKRGLEGWRFPPPEGHVLVDQKACRYVPRVTGARVGQEIRIHTSDDTQHNVQALPVRQRGFNVSQSKAGMVVRIAFYTPEVMVPLKCQLHGWMSAWIGVVPHPFFAVTDERGTFELPPLPPGDYTLDAWHEFYGRKAVAATVEDRAVTQVAVEYAAGQPAGR
ncbi:MAG: carboxypeptidase regulatory-like domain-containing protein [Planctomycetota bacterium]